MICLLLVTSAGVPLRLVAPAGREGIVQLICVAPSLVGALVNCYGRRFTDVTAFTAVCMMPCLLIINSSAY